jgi:hypothetical protein
MITHSGQDNCKNTQIFKLVLGKIIKNLSCVLSSNDFDFSHAGIEIYDPFTITLNTRMQKEPKYERAISLSSKSCRKLKNKNTSFISLFKSLKSKKTNGKYETNDFYINKFNSVSKSPKIPLNNQKTRSRSFFDMRRKRKTLQEIFNKDQ